MRRFEFLRDLRLRHHREFVRRGYTRPHRRLFGFGEKNIHLAFRLVEPQFAQVVLRVGVGRIGFGQHDIVRKVFERLPIRRAVAYLYLARIEFDAELAF